MAAGYAVHRLPDRRLDTDGPLLRIRGFERDGRLYRDRFRVPRWKRRLPEGGAVFRGGFDKRTLPGAGPEQLARYGREARRAELGHWLAMAPLPLFALWNPPVLWPAMVLYAVLSTGRASRHSATTGCGSSTCCRGRAAPGRRWRPPAQFGRHDRQQHPVGLPTVEVVDSVHAAQPPDVAAPTVPAGEAAVDADLVDPGVGQAVRRHPDAGEQRPRRPATVVPVVNSATPRPRTTPGRGRCARTGALRRVVVGVERPAGAVHHGPVQGVADALHGDERRQRDGDGRAGDRHRRAARSHSSIVSVTRANAYTNSSTGMSHGNRMPDSAAGS